MKRTVLLLWALAPLSALAAGPTVWRCGPDGKTYSDTPCPGGRTLEARSEEHTSELQSH